MSAPLNNASQAGRVCPLAYRYAPETLCTSPELAQADVLYVIGGLYGNPLALDAVERLAAEEHASGLEVRLFFNGDFNWFNIEPAAFLQLNERVLAHSVSLGNVEAELIDPSPGAGCGCAYPAHVDPGVVTRSNQIMARLQATAAQFPAICERLRACPRTRCVLLGGQRILILHGDPESLAGWGLDPGTLADPAHQARLHDWFRRTDADLFACTHTCTPGLWQADVDGRARGIINNGAAGMGNAPGDHRGRITRISAHGPHPKALQGLRLGPLWVESLALDFDGQAWSRQFERWWPAGSPAHQSYARRVRGDGYADLY